MNYLAVCLNKILEVVVTLLVAALVFVVLWGVLSRFVINVPSRWTEELATQMLAWISMLGAAVAFRRHEHLGVDYFFNRWDLQARRINEIIIQLAILVFASGVMIWGGGCLAWATWNSGQITPALGIRSGLVYLCVPLSGLCIAVFALDEIGKIITKPGEES